MSTKMLLTNSKMKKLNKFSILKPILRILLTSKVTKIFHFYLNKYTFFKNFNQKYNLFLFNFSLFFN
jgi:hypothetical protein